MACAEASEMTGDLLTGRDSELGAIRRALSGAGNYCGVVICGAAGVGKTRLAREVLARAQAAGERTNWITGTESATPAAARRVHRIHRRDGVWVDA